MRTVLGVVIDYHLTSIVRYVMNVIGFGRTTVIQIILRTIVIRVVNEPPQRKANLYVLPAIQGLDEQ